MTIKAAGNMAVSGRQISIKAQNGVAIDGGAGAVEVKSVPKVAVQGAKVEVNGSAATDIKGGAMVTIQGALVKINERTRCHLSPEWEIPRISRASSRVRACPRFWLLASRRP
ncbi:MAG TPA: hypothetical protein VEU28_05735, partial [Actinomycetota bacterium]|nr:hypothetical protein [Actinomycetota bacterium]